MGVIDIVKYPAPVLKRNSLDVKNVDNKLCILIDEMTETMYAAKGIGLAAPQVGRSLRLSVLDVPDEEKYERGKNLLVLINPEIIEKEGKTSYEEGCLSVPGLTAEVPRYERVTVKAINREGEEFVISAEGLLAIALQHEVDHLNGKLFIDRLSRLKRDIFLRKLKKKREE